MLSSKVELGERVECEVMLCVGERVEYEEMMCSKVEDGDVMIVGQTDMGRLFDRLGQKFTNSSELVGVVYAKMCEVDEAKAEATAATEDLKAYESRSPGRVVVDLGDQFATAQAKAKDAETPLKLWLDERLRAALVDNWF